MKQKVGNLSLLLGLGLVWCVPPKTVLAQNHVVSLGWIASYQQVPSPGAYSPKPPNSETVAQVLLKTASPAGEDQKRKDTLLGHIRASLLEGFHNCASLEPGVLPAKLGSNTQSSLGQRRE
jgi:hypothetical protein